MKILIYATISALIFVFIIIKIRDYNINKDIENCRKSWWYAELYQYGKTVIIYCKN